MKQVAVRPLSPREVALLNEAEETIAAGLTTFIEVGGALLTISEGRLYRREYATFEEYCTAKWQIGRAYAYRLMDAVRALLTIGDTDLPLPTNEAQARALANVDEDRRVEVWGETLKRTDNKPTAAAIAAVANETAGAASGGTPAPAPNQPEASPGAPVEADDQPSSAAGAGTCDPAPAPQPPDANPSSVRSGGATEPSAPSAEAEPAPASADPIDLVVGAIQDLAAETGVCPACQRPLR